MLYACSKCFTRHPYEELSQGQQLCKKCRGDFPVVKCTYCRSEFQQESKSKTSSVCKRCEQNVAQYGKPTTCQYCQLPAAFVGGKCQRCSHYSKRYGPPKICEQCKQKSAFDKGDNSKLMCWACSCSYKRALAKTKQSDPARHSRVFKKEKERKHLTEEDRVKKRERYMNSKKPNRPDVTKIELEAAHVTTTKVAPPKKEVVRDGDTDHVGEITQLKEKIAFFEKTIKQKENQMISKDREICQMKAKLFNEEKLIRQKMQSMARLHDDKVTELNSKIRALNNEISKLRKDSRNPNRNNKKDDNLFKDSRKRAISRNNSPVQPRSRSRSPVNRSRSRSPAENQSAKSSAANSVRSSPSRSPSPAAKQARIESPDQECETAAAPAPQTTDNNEEGQEDQRAEGEQGDQDQEGDHSSERPQSSTDDVAQPMEQEEEEEEDKQDTTNSRSPSPARSDEGDAEAGTQEAEGEQEIQQRPVIEDSDED